MKRHDSDFFSLAAGLLFTALGVVLMASAIATKTIDGRWLAPIMLVVLGAGGVAASLAANSRQRRAAAELESAEESVPMI